MQGGYKRIFNSSAILVSISEKDDDDMVAVAWGKLAERMRSIET